MTGDQAIFTSMIRQGKAGYHVVARSAGVTESEARAFATWSPSHGGLAVDASNRASVNVFPLPTGRYAVARSVEGRGEYSGRGGRQLFTRAVFFDAAQLQAAGHQVFRIYRDAFALGHLHFVPDPPAVLPRVTFSLLRTPDGGRSDEARRLEREFEAGTLATTVARLEAGQSVLLAHAGDRLALAEYIVSQLPAETVQRMSLSTSLLPSSVRPFRLNLVARR